MADIEKVKKGVKACLTECIFLKHYHCPYKTGRDDYKCVEQLREDVLELLKEQQPKWIPVEERLPENAQHKGAHCPRYKVYTKWGETEGWYNPDKGCWYFLLWYFDGEKVDFEHGDNPKLAHEINGAKVVTHWMPLSEPPKDGEAE